MTSKLFLLIPELAAAKTKKPAPKKAAAKKPVAKKAGADLLHVKAEKVLAVAYRQQKTYKAVAERWASAHPDLPAPQASKKHLISWVVEHLLTKKPVKKAAAKKPKAPKVVITDIGEKIGGARKDRYGGSKVSKDPIDETPAWKKQFVVVESTSYSRLADAYIPVWQVINTRKGRRNRTTGKLTGQRISFEEYKTKEEAEQAAKMAAIAEKFAVETIYPKKANGDTDYTSKRTYVIKARVTKRSSVQAVDEVFDSALSANKYLADNADALLSGKKASFGMTPEEKAEEKARPKWAKGLAIRQVPGSSVWRVCKIDPKKGPLGYNKHFASKEDAEKGLAALIAHDLHWVIGKTDPDSPEDADGRKKYLYEIFRDVGHKVRARVKVLDTVFNTRAEADAYIEEHAEELLSDVKPRTGGYGEDFLATPKKVVRIGPAWRKEDAKPEQFMTKFGFRGVEFGNWQGERQDILNNAFDGLSDLANALEVTPETISLSKSLALAFGARGKGGKGAARAHYEPVANVINLTKKGGAGSLAHEWWHATDQLLNRINETKGRKPYASETLSGFAPANKLPPKVVTAYKDLLDSIMYKKTTETLDPDKYHEEYVEGYRTRLKNSLDTVRKMLATPPVGLKRKSKPATEAQLSEFDSLAAHLMAGNDSKTRHVYDTLARKGAHGRRTNDTLDKISNLLFDIRGTTGFGSGKKNGEIDNIGTELGYVEAAKIHHENIKANPTRTRTTDSDYLQGAKKLDRSRSKPYWTENCELTARAFSAYVEDKLADANQKSDYMSYGSNNKHYAPFHAFPEGDERTTINAKFDDLIKALRETDIFKAGPPMKKSKPSAAAAKETPADTKDAPVEEADEGWEKTGGILMPKDQKRLLAKAAEKKKESIVKKPTKKTAAKAPAKKAAAKKKPATKAKTPVKKKQPAKKAK